jgi:aryl-alcohol dehydrogenase-like predicted oxidoreductase
LNLYIKGADVAASAAGPARIGLGCMALTGIYGAIDGDVAQATIHAALDLGIQIFDTAALYADGTNEELLGRTIGDRDDVFVVTKFGLFAGGNGTLVRDSSTAAMRASVDASLQRLRKERIDLLLQHRPDPRTDDAVVAGVATDLMREGKIAAFGLSGSAPERAEEFGRTIPVAAMQNELSLANPERQNEPAILDQAGAMFMAYAPLGRGLLTGRSRNVLVPGDLRERMPQFQDDAEKANLERLAVVDEIAAKHATSRTAVALAWTLHVGNNVVPIPGARSPEQVRTAIMAADLALTSDETLRLSASAQQIAP